MQGIEKRYPSKRIQETDDWFQIEIIEYKKNAIFQSSLGNILDINNGDVGSILNQGLAPIGDSLQRVGRLDDILLPMPQNIQDTNSVGWGDDSLNNLAAAGLNFAKGTIGSPDGIAGFVDKLKEFAIGTTGAAVAGTAQALVQNYFASQAVNALGANTSLDGVLARTSGSILNPNMELLFKSVTLRSFTFEWDLIPRDSDEATIVWAIIRTLKKNMAAKKSSTGALFINSPNVFRLKYMSGSSPHPFLHSFKPCALVQMGVNYTGNGSYATYYDKTPVHLKMSLSFQELNPIYDSDYDPTTEAKLGINGVGY